MIAFLLAMSLAVAPPPAVDEDVAPQEVVEKIARPATQELKTARFRIVYTQRASGAAQYLAKEIEPLRDQLQAVLGRDWPGVTEVRLGFGRSEYEALALPGGSPPGWAVALAYPEQNVMLVEAHSLIQGDGQATLRHELVHVALGRLGKHWPRWFQEGLAQELTGERKFRWSQYATLARAVAQERVFAFDDLSAGFPNDPGDVEIAYAQSVDFVATLHEKYGSQAFGALIDRVAEGANFEKAFGLAFHTSLSVQEKSFRLQLTRRYPWWPMLVGGGSALWTLSALLVVVAFVRRRRALARWHAKQAEFERLEDGAARLILALSTPANDDRAFGADLPPGAWVVRVQKP